jgi:two-component system phosphate regulon sensor histidine kinase PhoR
MSLDRSPDITASDSLRDRAVQALLDAVDEGLLVVDQDGRVVCSNQRLWELFGMAPTGDLAEIRARVIGCMADPDAYLTAVEEAPGETVCDLELVRPERRTVRRRTVPLLADGRPVGHLVAYRDVTRDVEVSRLKSEFVANVSHELRTPMAAIKGFLGVVLDDEETMSAEVRRRFLTIAREQTDRLSRLIDDLLDLSRIESGRRPRRHSRVQVRDLIRDVAITARPDAVLGEVQLVVEEPPPELYLTGDRDQLAQVLFNLLTNAIKFTPAGGRVTLSAGREAGELRLAVSDTGCGIAPSELRHVFDKFYRSGTAGRRPRGAGLGLAIARELVEGHGGRVEVASRLGEGSTFTVRLPLGAAGEEA